MLAEKSKNECVVVLSIVYQEANCLNNTRRESVWKRQLAAHVFMNIFQKYSFKHNEGLKNAVKFINNRIGSYLKFIRPSSCTFEQTLCRKTILNIYVYWK
jgi:hypothetical protein